LSITEPSSSGTHDRTASPRWRPPLDGPLRDRSVSAIDDIARDLSRPYETWALNQYPDPTGLRAVSLASGRAGVALFYHYLATARKSDRLSRLAEQYLEDAIDRVPQCVMLPSLFCGFTGVAWVAQEMQPSSESMEDEDGIDAVLIDCVERSPWSGAYDLIDGLAGLGIYFLDRLPQRHARRALAAIVQRLEETAASQDGGLTWPPSMLPNNRLPDDSPVLGTAHGIPAVIVLLAAAYAAGIQKSLAAQLYQGAVDWLMRQGKPDSSDFTFPNVRGVEHSRSAWCYGDPGMAGALFTAASLRGDDKLTEFATQLAFKAARRERGATGVMDAGLCHGAAGLAHLYNRMYQTTHYDELREAATTWFERTLDYHSPGTGVGGFSAWSYEENRGGAWADDPCWLTGAAGVGLALLGGVADLDPSWDRVMALSAIQQWDRPANTNDTPRANHVS